MGNWRGSVLGSRWFYVSCFSRRRAVVAANNDRNLRRPSHRRRRGFLGARGAGPLCSGAPRSAAPHAVSVERRHSLDFPFLVERRFVRPNSGHRRRLRCRRFERDYGGGAVRGFVELVAPKPHRFQFGRDAVRLRDLSGFGAVSLANRDVHHALPEHLGDLCSNARQKTLALRGHRFYLRVVAQSARRGFDGTGHIMGFNRDRIGPIPARGVAAFGLGLGLFARGFSVQSVGFWLRAHLERIGHALFTRSTNGNRSGKSRICRKFWWPVTSRYGARRCFCGSPTASGVGRVWRGF